MVSPRFKASLKHQPKGDNKFRPPLTAESKRSDRSTPRFDNDSSLYQYYANMNKGDNARCRWCLSDPIYIEYHDEEWGVPVHKDRKLFEFLILEGAQAGLSWLTILRRRAGYRKAFAEFTPEKVARFGERDVRRLMKDQGIIRNQAKIRSAISNAKAFLEIQDQFGSFANYSWRFVDGKPKVNRRRSSGEIPATSPESDAFSKDMKQRGFKFVGSTIMYAHMQAVGMVNDHLVTCFRYKGV